ncbi:MAG: hypothetical protein WBI44_10150 [Syntrophaceticus sp.]
MPRIIGYRCPICKTVNPTEIKYCLKCGQWLLDTINEATTVTRGNYFNKTKIILIYTNFIALKDKNVL